MMVAVTATLRQFGAIGPEETPRYHIGLTRGDTLWLDAYRADGRYFHAKVAEYVTLHEEERTYREAFAVFREFMPAPIGYAVHPPWEIFVAEGVDHEGLPGDVLDGRMRARTARTELYQYFATSTVARGTAQSAEGVDALLRRLRRTFDASPFAPLLAPWDADEGRRELEALGAIPQHGDFVANNIGMRGSRLVVYDWEDYGKVSLPGFDLCTLAMSLAEASWGQGAFGAPGPRRERLCAFLAPACRALGLTLDAFWRLVPLYLLAFLDLKQTYAAGIRTRVEDLLRPFCEPVHATRS